MKHAHNYLIVFKVQYVLSMTYLSFILSLYPSISVSVYIYIYISLKTNYIVPVVLERVKIDF